MRNVYRQQEKIPVNLKALVKIYIIEHDEQCSKMTSLIFDERSSKREKSMRENSFKDSSSERGRKLLKNV